ncbi:hypothetical protein NM208_g12714 [Fusarium decemcellulare]|uniref:Uncharacterized protein n=1 Tax=Fusarium decemcellulare TaxID=57161 RepID=A0ACC1RPK7_9HYPO|nr:hypothetical protein NM208_g12714 [Fusarium decemcellulare]
MTSQTAGPPRLFQIDRTSFILRRRLVIHTGKPDLTLHKGGSTNDPVVAACHLPKFSGGLKFGLASPAGPDLMNWEELTRQSLLTTSEYRWETEHVSGPRALLWKRTHSVGVSGSSPSTLSVRNWKLVDEKTGDILAVFTSDRTLSKCGDLEVRANHGEQFDQRVLITCLGLYEKAKRRSRNSGAGSGGGGG